MATATEAARAAATTKLLALRDSYIARMPLRLQEIHAAWGAYREAPSGAALLAMRRLVHKLAGTAGLFGLRDAGRHAMALEQLIEAGMESGEPDLAQIEQHLQQIAA